MYYLGTEKGKGFTIIRHEGDMRLGDAVALRSELTKYMMEKGVKTIALDLRKTRHLDSSGLGALVSVQTLAVSHGRNMFLISPPEHVRNLLKKLELDEFFGEIPTEDILTHMGDFGE